VCRIVFADISMPGADGFAVLNAARAANPSTYVVIITGYGSLETAITAVRLGAQDYLTKPFSLGQVDVILKQAAARFALEQERRRKADREVVAALTAIEERLASIETSEIARDRAVCLPLALAPAYCFPTSPSIRRPTWTAEPAHLAPEFYNR
jgi:DNA-binding NtrC family response regulator